MYYDLRHWPPWWNILSVHSVYILYFYLIVYYYYYYNFYIHITASMLKPNKVNERGHRNHAEVSFPQNFSENFKIVIQDCKKYNPLASEVVLYWKKVPIWSLFIKCRIVFSLENIKWPLLVIVFSKHCLICSNSVEQIGIFKTGADFPNNSFRT